MKKRKMSVKFIFNLIGVIFTIVGAVFLISGSIYLISDIDFRSNAEQTQGTIRHIETDVYRWRGKLRTSHYVTVEYTVDGENYSCEIGQYNSGMYVGKELTIYYDPDEPGNARIYSVVLPAVFMGIGGLFLILGIVFIAVNAASSKRIKSLMENGEALTGIVTNVTLNTSMRVNGRHPYKAECEVTDPYSGERYLYSSKNVTEDISGLIGSEVTVYTDRNDRSKYYVDIDGLLSRETGENIHDYR
ncbi:MAG: DUF3592 domain-containing protein [Clostridium sp.]|nr:DUF3592 domain-containing protein [Clostridium sp.]MCM1547422.1 DUF3592 domain-containing protein [Ruminococcus sp.]